MVKNGEYQQVCQYPYSISVSAAMTRYTEENQTKKTKRTSKEKGSLGPKKKCRTKSDFGPETIALRKQREYQWQKQFAEKREKYKNISFSSFFPRCLTDLTFSIVHFLTVLLAACCGYVRSLWFQNVLPTRQKVFKVGIFFLSVLRPLFLYFFVKRNHSPSYIFFLKKNPLETFYFLFLESFIFSLENTV